MFEIWILFIFMFPKKYSKIIISILLVFGFWLTLQGAGAVDLQVDIPGQSDAGKDLAHYVAAWYTFGVSAISIIAVVMIMWGGFEWITAAGSATLIGQAKGRIMNAIVGIILVLTSYGLLYLINPALVELRMPVIETIEKVEIKIVRNWDDYPFCLNDNWACGYIKEEKSADIAMTTPCRGVFANSGEDLCYVYTATDGKKFMLIGGVTLGEDKLHLFCKKDLNNCVKDCCQLVVGRKAPDATYQEWGTKVNETCGVFYHSTNWLTASRGVGSKCEKGLQSCLIFWDSGTNFVNFSKTKEEHIGIFNNAKCY